jgi:hypothetical protein
MAKFMYLLRMSGESSQPRSPEQMEQAMKKYMAWKDRLEQGGHLHDFGEPLAREGRVVRDYGKVVSDGPFVEVKDFVQGYMFVTARDLEEAVALAQESPMVEGGGTLEVRPVASM